MYYNFDSLRYYSLMSASMAGRWATRKPPIRYYRNALLGAFLCVEF